MASVTSLGAPTSRSKNAKPIDVILFGLGPMGQRIACTLAARQDVRIIGAVDIDEAVIGRDLGEILGEDKGTGILISPTADEALNGAAHGVVVHATSSRLDDVLPQVMAIVGAGWNVLSTCEELTYPWSAAPEAIEAVNQLARENDVSVLATGINPGFVMDVLPLFLTAACVRVDSLEVHRIVDTNRRRLPLQQKAGVGMERDQFVQLAARKQIGHVGLKQSAYLLAAGLGWELSAYSETLEPVIASRDTGTGLGMVPSGSVIGQHQIAYGFLDDREVVRLELEMIAGVPPVDVVTVLGEPTIRQVTEGGINGDIGTQAVIANLVPVIAAARPGLLSMLDVVPVRCLGGSGSERLLH